LKLDEQIEDLFKSKKSTKDKNEAPKVGAPVIATPLSLPITPTTPAAAAQLIANAASVAEKLRQAKNLAEK
jgi:hypothetical protein